MDFRFNFQELAIWFFKSKALSRILLLFILPGVKPSPSNLLGYTREYLKFTTVATMLGTSPYHEPTIRGKMQKFPLKEALAGP